MRDVPLLIDVLVAGKGSIALATRGSGKPVLQSVLRRLVLVARRVGDAGRHLLLLPHVLRLVLRVGVDPLDGVLPQVHALGLRRAIRGERDGDVERRVEVVLGHLDGGGLGRVALGLNLAGVVADADLGVGDRVGPGRGDLAPVRVSVEADRRVFLVRRRSEAARVKRPFGLALDLDRDGRDLGLIGVDHLHRSGGGRSALLASESGDRGHERREEVAVVHLQLP